jgi:pilus assembly protein Flp/PilA
MRSLVLRFVNDQSAATAIEYGLIAAGIALAIIAVVGGLGTQHDFFQYFDPAPIAWCRGLWAEMRFL